MPICCAGWPLVKLRSSSYISPDAPGVAKLSKRPERLYKLYVTECEDESSHIGLSNPLECKKSARRDISRPLALPTPLGGLSALSTPVEDPQPPASGG